MQSLWIVREVDSEEDIIKEDGRKQKQTQLIYKKDGSVDVIYRDRIDRLTADQVKEIAPLLMVPTKGYDALLQQAQTIPPIPADSSVNVPHDKDR
jgi:hypothetical protein